MLFVVIEAIQIYLNAEMHILDLKKQTKQVMDVSESMLK